MKVKLTLDTIYLMSPLSWERTGLRQGLTECPTRGKMKSGRENGIGKQDRIPHTHTPLICVESQGCSTAKPATWRGPCALG